MLLVVFKLLTSKRLIFSSKLFDILFIPPKESISGRLDENIRHLDVNSLKTSRSISCTKNGRISAKAVCLKGEVYFFGGYDSDNKRIMSVDKYSPHTNTWSKVTDMFDRRFGFSACTFMHKIYILGGMTRKGIVKNRLRSCFQFDTENCTWKEVAEMNHVRSFAACTTYKGNVVISGGRGVDNRDLNITESYDAFGNFWTQMPNMLSSKTGHSLVEVNNKLFAGGGNGDYTCEVLDDVSNKFVAVKTPIPRDVFTAIAVGVNFFAFKTMDLTDSSTVYKYDVEKEEWFEVLCEVTKLVYNFCCFKLLKV